MRVDLATPVSLRSSFFFPLQSQAARRDVVWGAVLLLALPGLGWILNMGHRVVVVGRARHLANIQEPIEREVAREALVQGQRSDEGVTASTANPN